MIHECPRAGTSTVPCCGMPVLELSPRDRITTDQHAVTCGNRIFIVARDVREAVEVAEERGMADTEWRFLRDQQQLHGLDSIRVILTAGAAERADTGIVMSMLTIHQRMGRLRYV